MPLHTHYDNLQVKETASLEVIKGAYRHLAQKWHPDRHEPAMRAKAERITRLINAAFEELSDPVKRAAHDRWIKAERAKEAKAATAAPPPPRPASPPQHPQKPPPPPETPHQWGYLGPMIKDPEWIANRRWQAGYPERNTPPRPPPGAFQTPPPRQTTAAPPARTPAPPRPAMPIRTRRPLNLWPLTALTGYVLDHKLLCLLVLALYWILRNSKFWQP